MAFKFLSSPLYKDGVDKVNFSNSGETVDWIDYLEISPPEIIGNSVYVFAIGDFESGKKFDFQVRWEFERDLTEVDSKMIELLHLFSLLGPMLLTKNDHWNVPENYSYLTPISVGSIYDPHIVESVWNNLCWQNRVSHVWACLSKDSSDPGVFAGLLKEFLPENSDPGFYNDLPGHVKDITPYLTQFDGIDAKDVTLSNSFGKESLLSYLLLEKILKGNFEDMKFATIEHVGAEYQGVDKESIAKLEEATGYHHKTIFVKTNIRAELLKNFNWFDVIDVHTLPALHIAQMINSGSPIVVFGDEFERTVAEPIEVDGKNTVNYTMDYPQSLVWHARLNKMLGDLDLTQSLGSVLYNLTEFQIQWLLYKINPKVLDFQNSCWYVHDGNRWCNNCEKCERIAFMREALGLPLPRGLNRIDPNNMKSHSGRALFAIDLGAGPDNPGLDPTGTFLDRCFHSALHKIKGEPFERIPELKYYRPDDYLHKQVTDDKVKDFVQNLLADHPLS